MLKFQLGDLRIHLGLLTIAVLVPFFCLKHIHLIFSAVRDNRLFIGYLVYCVISGYLLNGKYFVHQLPHVGMIFIVLLFVWCVGRQWQGKFFLNFQYVLIGTGLFQFVLAHLFDYQLHWFFTGHYMGSQALSLGGRLRGFFLEPNWYGISMSFNTLLLVGPDIEKFLKKRFWPAVLSALVLVLNGSWGAIGGLFIVYGGYQIIFKLRKSILVVFLGALVLCGGGYFRSNVNVENRAYGGLNHQSRLLPLVNVFKYQIWDTEGRFWWGNGFGRWGTLAIDRGLAVIQLKRDVKYRGSCELPTMLFEVGIFGVAILLLDSILLYRRCRKGAVHHQGGIILFWIYLILYPTFQFIPYMISYFILRYKIAVKIDWRRSPSAVSKKSIRHYHYETSTASN